jgi:ABC-2 type transport system permease protein
LQYFAVREVADEKQARRLVEREELIAALIIPPDFSESLAEEHATIRVYISGSENILGAAFKSVVETLAFAVSSGEIALSTAIQGLLANPRTRTELQMGKLDEDIANLVFSAVMPESYPIQIRRIPPVVFPAQINLAHYLAASIAIMFIGFTALMVSAAIFNDKEQWTLQRMYISPTRPGILLGGKILGTYLVTLIQMGVLVTGMTIMEWLQGTNASSGLVSAGQPKIDLVGLTVLILAVTAAATGAGVAIAGLAGTYTQAANYGRALLVLMGLVGGIFFPVELFPEPFSLVSRITYHYWGLDGYLKLALGGDAASILLHCFVLIAMGVLFFAVGNYFLRRRIEFL